MTNRYALDEIEWPDAPFSIRERAVLVARRGSEAHGTYVPPASPDSSDDRDVAAVYVAPHQFYFGLHRPSWDHYESIKGHWDVVADELRKFVSLLCKQNPNVLALLYLEAEDYLHLTPSGRHLIECRELFQDRDAAYAAFMGYAHGQMKRMTSFGQFKGYMGAKRKALVERYGYDTKNASHLIRILRMGLEYIRTGHITVRRVGDRDELLAIKQGRWPLVQVQALAADLFATCESALATSPLRRGVPVDEVDRLVTYWVRRELSGHPWQAFPHARTPAHMSTCAGAPAREVGRRA